MEYRLIRHTVTGETLVIGADGYLSGPLCGAEYLTMDAELRADWWRVPRAEYNTALWRHPLWAVLATAHGGWLELRQVHDGPAARPRAVARGVRHPAAGPFPLGAWAGDGAGREAAAGE
ncbi:MAG TPA: hypothetical protein VFL91_09660 [Thermomicrobiales bacterium]|nr:hypothetical protein [Thermomicrobiales bacterium]